MCIRDSPSAAFDWEFGFAPKSPVFVLLLGLLALLLNNPFVEGTAVEAVLFPNSEPVVEAGLAPNRLLPLPG